MGSEQSADQRKKNTEKAKEQQNITTNPGAPAPPKLNLQVNKSAPAPPKLNLQVNKNAPAPPKINLQVNKNAPAPPKLNMTVNKSAPAAPKLNLQVNKNAPAPPKLNLQVNKNAPAPPKINLTVNKNAPVAPPLNKPGVAAQKGNQNTNNTSKVVNQNLPQTTMNLTKNNNAGEQKDQQIQPKKKKGFGFLCCGNDLEQPHQASNQAKKEQKQKEKQTVPSEQPSEIENLNENSVTVEEPDENMKKYIKLLKIGVRAEQVKMKMQAEGYNPNDIDPYLPKQ